MLHQKFANITKSVKHYDILWYQCFPASCFLFIWLPLLWPDYPQRPQQWIETVYVCKLTVKDIHTSPYHDIDRIPPNPSYATWSPYWIFGLYIWPLICMSACILASLPCFECLLYSWFHIKGTWSVHSFNGDYLSIPSAHR